MHLKQVIWRKVLHAANNQGKYLFVCLWYLQQPASADVPHVLIRSYDEDAPPPPPHLPNKRKDDA